MTSNGVDRGTENNGRAQVKNRCLARCNYSIRGLSVNLPHQQQVFLQPRGGDGQKNDCDWTERSPTTSSPITTDTIECLLMDKCTLRQRSLQHPTGYSSVSKCSDRCTGNIYHWADILITCNIHPSVVCLRWIRHGPINHENLGLNFFRKYQMVDKEKPTRWKSTRPNSADFQTNIMITIFWPFGVCCFRLWQSRQKKPGKKKIKTAPIWS